MTLFGGVGASLTFPLGGAFPPVPPRIFNLAPSLDDENVSILTPVRMSFRDPETNIDPLSINVAVGYASVHSDALEVFDKELPNTSKTSIRPGIHTNDPLVIVTTEGVQIKKTSSDPQRSVYVTTIPAGSGFPSAMFSIVLRPDTISLGDRVGIVSEGPLNDSLMPGGLPVPYSESGSQVDGAIFGLEYGPRNTGVYVLFQNAGAKRVRIIGPNLDGTPSPDISFPFDWSLFHRYTLLWNEASGKVELYANTKNNTPFTFFATDQINSSIPISSFEPFGTLGGGTQRYGGAGDIVGLYGVEGPNNNQVTISNIAITTNVGFPIINGVKTGDFVTKLRSDERIGFKEENPLKLDVSPWFLDNDLLFTPKDSSASVELVTSPKAVRLTKQTLGSTFGIYREEPAFIRSRRGGIYLEVKFFGVNSRLDEAGAGMGFLIWDGNSVFQFNMFDDKRVRTVGILKKGGDPKRASDHIMPLTPVSWSSAVRAIFVIDPGRVNEMDDMNSNVRLEIFLDTDRNEPIYSEIWHRDYFPTAEDFGYVDIYGEKYSPFIAFGHLTPLNSVGSLYIYDLEYSSIYEAWEARDGLLPDNVNVSPTWELIGTGIPTLSPTSMTISTIPGQRQAFIYRSDSPGSPLWGETHGITLEARLSITTYKALSRSGVYIIADDGNKTLMLSFVDTEIGKFITLALSSGLGGYKEKPALSGTLAKYSHRVDWTEVHTYRMERRPNEGLTVFLDNEAVITLAEKDMSSLPSSQLAEVAVVFGQYSPEGASADWRFVRLRRGSGYEVSTKKNKPPEKLHDELFATQGLVVANIADRDE